ncbi:MAG: hypothetical protein DMG65_17870 [Candidatus Angelobacter sp. Gp1-AA117]|nr:MAG: hypothetical protein DMG65_17870 [Candidatus Angelobacter sp. Gp1-AA117]
MKYWRCVFILCVLGMTALLAQYQNQSQSSPVPTLSFDLYWEAATPQNYTITVDALGAAHYVSRNPTRAAAGAEPDDPEYDLHFTISGPSRDRIFNLAQELNYFQGQFDYKQHRIANTGAKTLHYQDATRDNSTTYNWSENKSIQELTRLFQGISNTLQFGEKLKFKKRFDKLGLEKELKGMEDLAQNQDLAELQIIAPVLQNIADDTSVLHVARERARRLLAQAGPSKD